MSRKWTVRVLAIGGLAAAVGCRTASPDVMPDAMPVTTPLYPEAVVGGPPPMPPLAPGETLVVPPAPHIPPSTTGAQLPKPGLVPAPMPKKAPEVQLKKDGPDLPSLVLPDLKPVLTSNPKPVGATKPIEPTKPTDVLPPPSPVVVKPLFVDPPKPAAGPDGFAPAPIIPPPTKPSDTARPLLVETRPEPLPLATGQKFGHAHDYHWVSGVLDRHAKGGYWTIRYADAGRDDPWGGKVRLVDDDRLKEYRNGDVVFVQGDITPPPAGTARLDTVIYPTFRAKEIRLIERGQ